MAAISPSIQVAVGVMAALVVVYRIVYLMVPMLQRARREQHWGLAWQALTLLV